MQHGGGGGSDLITHPLPYFFKTSSSFLCKPFHLIFSSSGMSILDRHRGDPSYQAGLPDSPIQSKLLSNFNITVALVFIALASSESS